jgi:hypothetical protein
MPSYDGQLFTPPAPVARVMVRTRDRVHRLDNVAMLIDTGSDVTVLPQGCARELGLEHILETGLRLQSFDCSVTATPVVEAELLFLGYNFHGRFPLIDGDYGIIGRNMLNNLSLVLDGPHLNWREERTSQ